MNFFKNIALFLVILFLVTSANADNHDKEQNIVEKAKEINKKVKEIQKLFWGRSCFWGPIAGAALREENSP